MGNIVSYINSLLKCYETYQFENKNDILLSFCKQNATMQYRPFSQCEKQY